MLVGQITKVCREVCLVIKTDGVQTKQLVILGVGLVGMLVSQMGCWSNGWWGRYAGMSVN